MLNNKDFNSHISLKKNTYTDIDDVLFSSFRTYYKTRKNEETGISLNKTKLDFMNPESDDTYIIPTAHTHSQKPSLIGKPISTILVKPSVKSQPFLGKYPFLRTHANFIIIPVILFLTFCLLICIKSRVSKKNSHLTQPPAEMVVTGSDNHETSSFSSHSGENLFNGLTTGKQEVVSLGTTEQENGNELKKTLIILRELKKTTLADFKIANRQCEQKNYKRAYLQFKLIKTSLEKSIESYKNHQEQDIISIICDLEEVLTDVNSNIFGLETDMANDMLKSIEAESAEIRQEISSLQKSNTNNSPLLQQREAKLQTKEKRFYDLIENNLITLNTFTTLTAEEKNSFTESLNKALHSVQEFQSQMKKAKIIYEEAQNAVNEKKLLEAQVLINQIPSVNDDFTEKIQSLKETVVSLAGSGSRFYMIGHHWPGFQFRWCPPGNFKMGGSTSNDNSARSVNIKNGFWILETEVTQAMWQSVMGTKPFVFTADKFQNIYEYMPAENVSFEECLKFCKRLTERFEINDCIVSLPTESEWEYACCAGGNSDSFAAKILPAAKSQTSRVKTAEPNSWGIYDMLGNVAEFCLRDGTESSETETTHIAKGGDWELAKDSSINLTPYYRSTVEGNESNGRTGFRVVIKTKPMEQR